MYIKHILGKLGEDLVEKYLIDKNYKIIERNFRGSKGEIDIIAKEDDEIVFIEVKTRSSVICGRPSEAVNKLKKKHLIQTIKYYLYLNKLEDKNIRIDVIEVYISKNNVWINHIKQII